MGPIRGGRPVGHGRRRAGPLAVAFASILVVTGCASPTPTVPPSAGASGAPTSSQTVSPSQGAGGWQRVTPAGLPTAATLVPTKSGAGGVARDTAFLLTSLDGRSAEALASRLMADPPITFAVRASGSGAAVVTPTTPLAADTAYRISLPRTDGTVEAVWTATTPAPFAVTDTVPGDRATNVPLDSGIEVTFNEPGVTATAFSKHFAISPATTGRFEAKARSVAFVPDAPLRKSTLYTVTIRHGLPADGAGETLASDEVVRFETAGAPSSQVRVRFQDALVDVSTHDKAALGIWTDVPEDSDGPTSVPVAVHRLANLDAAVAAWSAVSDSPDWTVASTLEPVPTAGLPKVLTATLPVRTAKDDYEWLELPRALPVGWYVVTTTFGGLPRQVVLQVTDTATYVLATETQTAVWVNDLATGRPAAGATASIGGWAPTGKSDARGLLVAATPSGLAETDEPMVVVNYRGTAGFRPLNASGDDLGCGSPDVSAPGKASYWAALDTDRNTYRTTDTVNVVGVAKRRSDGSVPSSISVRLSADTRTGGEETPVVSQTATPDGRGMYAVALQIKDLPPADYRVRAYAGTTPLAERWFRVDVIRKPAYALSLALAKHAVVTGHPVGASVNASFFDGAPVAGVSIELTAGDEGVGAKVTTSASGTATGSVTPRINTREQVSQVDVVAKPTLPEEADITGSDAVWVFASTGYLSLDGSVSGSQVTFTGAVNAVAFSRFEQPGADLWSVDPRGAPLPGATVRLEFEAHYTDAVKTGTAYDFVTKRVVPVYDYQDRTVTLPSRTVRSDAKGAFTVHFATRSGADSYSVTAHYTDAGGHTTSTSAGASSPISGPQYGAPTLEVLDQDTSEYSVGDTVRVRFEGGSSATANQRYLFTILQDGLRYATVGTSPTFRTTFTAASVPAVQINSVRFNGTNYEVASGVYASLQLADRTLRVTLTPDKTRYEPGDTATVAVRTLGPDGRPVAASVFVGAVDEKLYALGMADEPAPLYELYEGLPGGIIGSAASHETPGSPGRDRDTCGGGGGGSSPTIREDFRDWLAARIVTTDADGRGSIAIALSDDLTTWRVVAEGVDGALNAGTASTRIPVGLPFFVDAVVAPEYLTTDRPVIRVRAYGTALPAGATVTFTISSDTLPMAATTVTAAASGSAYVQLPALAAGTQRLRIAATTGSGATAQSDALVRTFTVVDSRATQAKTTWAILDGTAAVRSGPGLTTVILADAGRGRVVPVLEELARQGAVRSDRVLAAGLANRVLTTSFGLPAATTTDEGALNPFSSSSGGLAIVGWGSGQLDVTALAAMTGDPRLSRSVLAEFLSGIASGEDETRARRLLATAGLAALGHKVTADLTAAAAQTDLTVEEQTYLALAALYAGDEALAGRLEQGLLAGHGLQSGDQLYIDPEAGADPSLVTARLAIVAASLGDPLAGAMDNWVASHPPAATVVDLERALAARGWAGRVPGATAVAAVTVDGSRRQVTVAPGNPVELTLTPAQAAGARIDRVSGSTLVVQSWESRLEPSTLTGPAGAAFERTTGSSATIKAAETVTVTLTVRLAPADRGGCWSVVDTVPSGLAPVQAFARPLDENGEVIETGYELATRITGQRVEFCTGGDTKQDQYVLRYVARVVTPGRYTWEPAVLQSPVDPGIGMATAPVVVTIETPSS